LTFNHGAVESAAEEVRGVVGDDCFVDAEVELIGALAYRDSDEGLGLSGPEVLCQRMILRGDANGVNVSLREVQWFLGCW